jgi:large subunit ribosomal protein L22
MAEVTAKLRYARISPQKCRLVADVVRGQTAGLALSTLKFMPKKGAKLVYKVLWSAVENARENAGLDVDDLKVSRIYVDVAPTFKRFAARAKGRGTQIVKRNSHITIAVSDGKKD